MDTLPALLNQQPAAHSEQEAADLQTLHACHLPVAPVVVVPPAAEEQFYLLNNLTERVRRIFDGIDLSDPDDEDIEDLAPEAHALVSSHYLLDEFIDAFYEATEHLPQLVRVRRPGQAGRTTRRGRQSLLQLKAAWSDEWTFDSLWERITLGVGLMPPPRPLFVHAAPFDTLPLELRRDAEALLGREVELLGGEGGIAGVAYAPEGGYQALPGRDGGRG